MKALTLAGRVILENGGETYRAEDTVLRMARALGLNEPDAFGVPSGLFISFTDENGERQTSVNRVHAGGTNLWRVDAVNQISRRLSEGELPPAELLGELEKAASLGKKGTFWHAPLSAMLTAAAFAFMFDGNAWDILISALCAGVTPLFPLLLRRGRDETLIMLLVGSFVCTLVPLCFHRLTGLGLPESMIAGALMPLVPGLSMTNAVQDVLRGDMVSGVAHGARALLTAALIAGGALMGTHLMNLLGGLM